jgi:hypothetical protein
MRVIHTPVNVGNQPFVLSRNERKLGVQSDVVVHYVSPALQYQADRVLGALGGQSDDELRARISEGLSAPVSYDVFHYYFGRTLFSWSDYGGTDPFPYLDLKLAKIMQKPIIFTLQGCDVRLAAESSARNSFTMCRSGACGFFESCITTLDAQRRRFIEDVLPLADKVFYLNPELGHYVQGEFLPYSNVEISQFKVTPPRLSGKIKIVHAPSDPKIKGTALILEALETLKSEYDFELILIQNMPHAEAMLAYRDADIVIDQVLAGWYGGFSVEVMAMGKPVLCYLREEDFGNVPAAMISDLPIVNIRPLHLAEDIRAAFDRRAEWLQWSENSRRYVEKWHNPAVIAAAMIEVYANPSAVSDFAPKIAAACVRSA